MSLPTPEYDRRTRDEVVAGAVAAVRRKVGAWTGQDRTDPGRGLIETCADMVMGLRDRLNLAPDQRRLQVLRLLGVRPYQPAPAQTEVVLQLAAPSPEPVVVPAGQEVATRPVGEAEPVVFSTLTEAVLNPCVLVAAGDFAESGRADGAVEGTLTAFGPGAGRTVEPGGPAFAGPAFHLNLPYFGDFPPPGDALADTGRVSTDSGGPSLSSYALVVLSVPVPSTRVTLDVTMGAGPTPEVGTGVTRGHWEAWQGTHWTGCRVVTDTVAVQGRPGKVTLDLPPAHAPAQLLLHRAVGEGGDSVQRLRDVGLIRYRADADRSALTRVALDPVLAVSVPVVQAGLVRNETLGTAAGTPGERLRFAHPPLPRSTDPLVVEAVLGERTAQWTYVASLAGSGPGDRHFTLDPRTGEAVFAPVVAGARGPRQHGAPLPAGAVVRIRRYLTGGGARGNVPARTITVLRTPLPYVSAVTNPAPAVGGTERESAAACATRLPLGAPVPERAVVPADYEQLALAASAGMARIHHVGDAPDDALDPARNYLPWRPAKTDVVFTLAPGALTVLKGIQVIAPTEDGETVFTTTEEATRVPPDAVGAAHLGLVPGVTAAVGMFAAGDYQAGGEFSGPFKEGGGLVLALVEIKKPHNPGHLTLWVTAGGNRGPEDRIAVSVFAPRKTAPWWDTAAPLAYASAPAQEITVADGPTVSAHPVYVSKSERWQAAVARGDLAGTAQDAVDGRGAGFPTEEAVCWIAVQILDPNGTPTTTYTVYADSGTTDPVPAEQYEEHDRAREPFLSTGEPGQVHPLLHSPVYGQLPKVRVGTENWHSVTSFHESLEDSKDVVINASTGQVHFGPKVTGGSSEPRQYGAVPLPEGTPITVDGLYKATLGAAGNGIPPGGISRLRNPDDDDHIVGVRNVTTSHDGKNGYTDTSGGSTQAGVTLMVIPFVTADERGWFPFHMLTPTRDASDTLRRSLRACQPEGVPVWLKQPVYHGIRVDARIVPADYRTAEERAELRAAAERALYRYFSPVGGGPDGTGWPLGRPVYAGEAFRVLEQVPGVGRVATAELVPVDLLDGSASDPVLRIHCGPGETVYSVEHRVTVAEVPS